MSNPNPFVPKGSLLEQQSQRRSRLKLAVFCVLAVSVTGLVAMLIQGCKRTPDADSGNPPPILADTNTPPPDTTTNAAVDTNAPVYSPPVTTNEPVAYTPPPPTPVVDTTTAGSDYLVVSGDTLGKIAKAHGVSLKALEAANPGVDSKHLKVKQKLTIPGSTGSADLTATGTGTTTDSDVETYTVKAGDTLSKIARTHGTTVKAIEAANNLTTTRINVGKKLKIPSKAEAAPAAVAPAPMDTTTSAPAVPAPSAPENPPTAAPATK